jgi:hypothetical protein
LGWVESKRQILAPVTAWRFDKGALPIIEFMLGDPGHFGRFAPGENNRAMGCDNIDFLERDLLEAQGTCIAGPSGAKFPGGRDKTHSNPGIEAGDSG